MKQLYYLCSLTFLFLFLFYSGHTQTCTNPLRIVVLGSSTAWGNGVPARDSAWTFRYRSYLKATHNAADTVIILAKGGNTTQTLQATGTPPYTVSGVTFPVDTTCNITRAIALAPDAIIVNIPNEDEARNFPLTVQVANLLALARQAALYNIPLWVATTQPRGNLGLAAGTRLTQMKDSINTYFGSKAIDFWSALADSRGYILPAYNSGDDALLNSAGQRVLFDRVVAKQLPQALCTTAPAPPFRLSSFSVATAGQQLQLSWTTQEENNTVKFTIERSIDTISWTAVGTVNAAGNAAAPRNYQFTDTSVALNQQYYYRLNMEATLNRHYYSNNMGGKVVYVPGSCNKALRIVVLGSSTAWGNGLPDRDSAWVMRYNRYLKQQHNSADSIILMAFGSSTTQALMPTGTPPYTVSGITYTVDTAHNITKAIALQPDAIIINMPSNDEARNFPISQQTANYLALKQEAAAHHVPLWVATTQPRGNLGYAAAARLAQMRDTINLYFGNKAIDFWSGLAQPNGYILPAYNSGDDVHFNAAGHAILFQRVVDKYIPAAVCPDTGTAAPVMAPVKAAYADAGHITSNSSPLTIFPNPATSYVVIPPVNNAPFILEVYNATGNRILSERRAGRTMLSVENWAPGIYIIQLIYGQERFRHRLVKI
ncbi:GDSL-type esterase/lipase family protein [Chitinophaga qingshengii]|uniref:T9SS type A sorting domain-containing protein n=1 Tax=Chitinophaga qingshengii TaxID=1569794 RepID=A0ABR7TW10_9BACT|nr:GDSL-type esterase/lipase family protein [Chitinophaga qingshengii]MBC9933566.1 T9SS type A sorting domain-containing protein [Chitinophaga qingshengii]